jgi:hypothetical protein
MKELKKQPVLEKSTITNVNEYNTFAEWADLCSYMPL